jgi:hypothetical protein
VQIEIIATGLNESSNSGDQAPWTLQSLMLASNSGTALAQNVGFDQDIKTPALL